MFININPSCPIIHAEQSAPKIGGKCPGGTATFFKEGHHSPFPAMAEANGRHACPHFRISDSHVTPTTEHTAVFNIAKINVFTKPQGNSGSLAPTETIADIHAAVVCAW